MDFEIIGDIRQAETFARGSGIRELPVFVKFMAWATGANEKALPQYVCLTGQCMKRKFIGMRLQALANVNSKLSVIKDT